MARRTKATTISKIADGKLWAVHQGDVEQVCKELPACSFDAALTDPPYGISFMGKGWDIKVPGASLWAEVMRVLKPGAPLISFSATRTYHRMAVQIEDGGFEIADMFSWLYGQGWPKGLDLSKALDKLEGHPRGFKEAPKLRAPEDQVIHDFGHTGKAYATEATTELGARWSGFNTQLKPGQEPACLGRKPLDGTYAENARRWGVGGFDVEASRVGEEGGVRGVGFKAEQSTNEVYGKKGKVTATESAGGRYPSNVILTCARDCVGGKHGNSCPAKALGSNADYFKSANYDDFDAEMIRFFYEGKASTRERGSENDHPTVKPMELMRYLSKMLLPPPRQDGKPRRILVPFCGSGSEMLGCMLGGWDEVVGIELDAHNAEVARWRVENARARSHELVIGGKK